MAKIVDPDQLTLTLVAPTTEEVAVDTDAKTIQLRIAGNLNDTSPGSTSGVTKQCLYSFLKEEWKTNATLNKFKFPLKAIYEAKFIWQYGWQPADDQTRDLVRDAGWQEIDGKESACLISLGTQVAGSQGYYAQAAGFTSATTNFDKTGALNEAVQIKGVGGTPDYTGYNKSFLRRWQYTYTDYEIISEQGFSALTYIAYRIPLANANDIKNDGSVTQVFIDGLNDPYQDMEIQYYKGHTFASASAKAYTLDEVGQDAAGRWFRCSVAGTLDAAGVADYTLEGGTGTFVAYPGERQIGPNYYAFNRAIQYNGVSTKPTKEQIYLFGQNALTAAGNINDDPDIDTYGTVNGEVAVRLSSWVGDILHSWPGLAFDNFNTNDTNSLVLNDIRVDGGGLDSEDIPLLSDPRTYPFTAAGNMVFSDNIVAEEAGTPGSTRRVMYFKNIAEQIAQTNFTISGATGANAVLNGTGMSISVGQYFLLSGFTTNDVNNGVKVATGSPTATVVPYTDALGRTQIDDITAEAVTLEEQPYDAASAIIVDDNSGVDIDGAVTAASIAFDFNYDGNVQGGRTAATPAKVIVVAQGLEESEWIFAEFTITRNTGLNFPVNAGDERTYLNPA